MAWRKRCAAVVAALVLTLSGCTIVVEAHDGDIGIHVLAPVPALYAVESVGDGSVVVVEDWFNGSDVDPMDGPRAALTAAPFMKRDDNQVVVDLSAIDAATRRHGDTASRVVVCVDEDRGSVSAAGPRITIEGNRSCAVAHRFDDNNGGRPMPFDGTITARLHHRTLWPRLWLPIIPAIGIPLAALIAGSISLRRRNQRLTLQEGRRWASRGILATIAVHVPLLWVWTDATDVPIGLDVQIVSRQWHAMTVAVSLALTTCLLVLRTVLSIVHARRTDPFRVARARFGSDAS